MDFTPLPEKYLQFVTANTNKITCWKIAGTTNTDKVFIQSVIPVSLNGFNLQEAEKTGEIEIEIWYSEKQNDYYKWKDWIHVKYQISNGKKSVPIPIKYERKQIFIATGLTRDHFWFKYDTFLKKERINSSIFKTNAEVKCTMPYTYEIDQLYTFNPMREYIDGHDDIIDDAFENFKIIHSKTYNNTEHHFRKTIFQKNLRFIHFKNRANLGYTLKVNFLADRTPEELNILRGYRNSFSNHGSTPKPPPSPRNIQKKGGNPPESFDWRKYGAVSPVKDQGMSCLSCWSFAAVGAVEGAFFIHSNKTIEPLSEQALIDCSWGFQNYGCYGGRPEHAFNWIIKHGGIPTEKKYGPYIGLNGYCHIKNLPLTANIAGWHDLANEGEHAIKTTLIKFGPIAVAINTRPDSFTFYSHGVYYDKECKPQIQNHAVLLVGYGITTSGEKYWILKNSYSENWGDDGYMSIAIKDNNCGVMNTPTYVTFKHFE